MATEWFKNDGSGVAINENDPCMLIVGDYVPDWIRVPEESPVRAGEQLRVVAVKNGPCPKCKREPVRHLELEHSFGVAECKPGCGFVFYWLSVNTKGMP
jgi:hypothetical protein